MVTNATSPPTSGERLQSLLGNAGRTAVAADAQVAWTQRRQVAAPTIAIAVLACVVLLASVIYLLVAMGTLTVRVAPSDPSAGALVQRQIAGDRVLADFATQTAQIQYGWTSTTVLTVGDRLSPYLSPKVRTEFLQQFATTASEASTYDRWNFVTVSGTHVFDRTPSTAAVAVHLDVAIGRRSKQATETTHSRFEELVAVYRLAQGMATPENPVGLVVTGVEVVAVARWKDMSREVFW